MAPPLRRVQFGTWTVIGAEQTASGYEIAWKVPGTDQYGFWSLDSSGNYVTNTPTVSGTSSLVESGRPLSIRTSTATA